MRILITACSNRQKYSILISQHLEQNSWLAVVMWFVLTVKVGIWNIHGCRIFLWFVLAWNIGSYGTFALVVRWFSFYLLVVTALLHEVLCFWSTESKMFPSCFFKKETFWAEVIRNWKLAQIQISYFVLQKNIFSYYDIRKCFNILFISLKISGCTSRNYF